MNINSIIENIAHWSIYYPNVKYLFIVILAFLEGHIISLICGFLARLGMVNIFLAWLSISLGNLIGDVVLYWLGFKYGMRFVNKYGKYFGLNKELVEKATGIFHRHKKSILFSSKLTNGFGMAMPILFTAGSIKIPFKTYMFWNVFGEFIWTATLLSLGYFLGQIVFINNIMLRIGLWFIFGLVVLLIARSIKKYLTKKLKI